MKSRVLPHLYKPKQLRRNFSVNFPLPNLIEVPRIVLEMYADGPIDLSIKR